MLVPPGLLAAPPPKCRRPSGLAGEAVDEEASQDSLADDDSPGGGRLAVLLLCPAFEGGVRLWQLLVNPAVLAALAAPIAVQLSRLPTGC